MARAGFPAILGAALLLPACAHAAGPAAPLPASQLELRVRELEDERAIREVLVLYGEYLDARDYAAYASLFASDGVGTGGLGSATGPAAIRAMLEANMGVPEEGFVNKEGFHLITTMVIHVDGDKATARSRYQSFRATAEGQPYILYSGRYFDELVRERGGWKIRRRTTLGVIPYRDPNVAP